MKTKAILSTLVFVTAHTFSYAQTADQSEVTADDFFAVTYFNAQTIIVQVDSPSDSPDDREWKQYQINSCVNLLTIDLSSLLFENNKTLTIADLQSRITGVDTASIDQSGKYCDESKGKIEILLNQVSEDIADAEKTKEIYDKVMSQF